VIHFVQPSVVNQGQERGEKDEIEIEIEIEINSSVDNPKTKHKERERGRWKTTTERKGCKKRHRWSCKTLRGPSSTSPTSSRR